MAYKKVPSYAKEYGAKRIREQKEESDRRLREFLMQLKPEDQKRYLERFHKTKN